MKSKALTPEKIRKKFRDEYVGTQGIYMTGITPSGIPDLWAIVAFVMEEDVAGLSLPDFYMGMPVTYRVQPYQWGKSDV